MTRRHLQILCLALLLAAMVATVWRIGVVCDDDAGWIINARQSLVAEGWRWATTQGRLYAAILGPAMLHAIYWDGTFYSEALKYGTFLGFVLLYLFALRFYVGSRTALLAGGLFAGLHALRFDGSALTSYSMLAWPSAMAAAAAILAGQRHRQTGGRHWLILAGAAGFFCLFTNEGLTIAFAGLIGLSWLGNCRLGGGVSSRDRTLGVTYAGAMVIYAALGIGFRLVHPSTYVGTEIAPFDIGRIGGVVWHFATSGSAPHSLFRPYEMDFGDAITGTYRVTRYQLGQSFADYGAAGPFFLLALALGWLIWSVLAEREISGRLPTWSAAMPGLVLLLCPILPVAMTRRYQTWHFEAGLDAYFTTIFAHLGYATLLAGLLASFCSGQALRALLIAAPIATLGFASMRTNERIAFDMRPEGLRWSVFRRAVPLVQAEGFADATLLLPQFANGSWDTVLPPSYWTDYSAYLYGHALPVSYGELTGGNAVLISYEMSVDRRDFDLLAGHLDAKANAIDSIAVELGRHTESEIANAVLSFYDRRRGARQVHLDDIRAIGKWRFILQGIEAEPGTLHLARQSVAGSPAPPTAKREEFVAPPAHILFADKSGDTIDGVVGAANAVQFPAVSAQYQLKSEKGGIAVTEIATARTWRLRAITGLRFKDRTMIIARKARAVSGALNQVQLAALHAAVFGSAPDFGRLIEYENYATAHPTLSPAQFALLLMPAHHAPSMDQYSIANIINNMLHRAPHDDEVENYYLNFIEPTLLGRSLGTSAYTEAEQLAYARLLAHISESPEFLDTLSGWLLVI